MGLPQTQLLPEVPSASHWLTACEVAKRGISFYPLVKLIKIINAHSVTSVIINQNMSDTSSLVLVHLSHKNHKRYLIRYLLIYPNDNVFCIFKDLFFYISNSEKKGDFCLKLLLLIFLLKKIILKNLYIWQTLMSVYTFYHNWEQFDCPLSLLSHIVTFLFFSIFYAHILLLLCII